MYTEKPDNSKQKVAAGLTALIVIALLASGAMVYGNQKTNSTSQGAVATITPTTSTSPSSSVAASPSSSDGTTTVSSGYKDGTYSASTDYYVPHGSESIKVTLTVTNGTVTNSSIENSEYSRESAQFQQEFAAEYKSYVVGKPLSSLQLDYVAGASDTTQGFNDAVQQIKSEARA